jgi:hypothetical protein
MRSNKVVNLRSLIPVLATIILLSACQSNGLTPNGDLVLRNKAEIESPPKNKILLSPSFIIPDEVWLNFVKAPNHQKKLYCNRIYDSSYIKNLIPDPIPDKIEGLNSKMDNKTEVQGFRSLDQFVSNFSAYTTSAFASDNQDHLVSALDALYQFASSNALLKTKQCVIGGKFRCPKDWLRKDGQDLSKSKDFSSVQMRVMHLFYAYTAFLKNTKIPVEGKKKVIEDWFAKFMKRNKPIKDVYFGLDLGWHWPELAKVADINYERGNRLASRIVKKLDKLILTDGSLKDRTTRGDRALWYHHEAIGETMITLEIARYFGVKIPDRIHKKIERAGLIFVNAIKDTSSLNPWASKAHNSTYYSGRQNFNMNISRITWANSWFYIFQYRYPNSNVTKDLKKLLLNYKNANRDGMVGIGLGCIYGSASAVIKGK